ncbi:heparan-alpha-glucosaminide N-acetyltransferase domain-containing protein [Pseudonocardia nigra]|uniref:heparan-alpha-glucosaminide N-acetyltransferase domain-containing protein n=1 Tax=Pseudonocardia nigra TaxID=1921578 RepID=UPI001C5F0AFD|nr:heparan-alpha-glucosaminide N-acetyltransferase domain-containing protein [Pseudonocardia nigra]
MRTGHRSSGDATAPPPGTAPTPRKERVVGVDVARGAALVGMMAAHVFPFFADDGTPTVSTAVTAARSAATFVLVAGVGLAFVSGGRTAVRGRPRTAVSAGIAVRALLIGAIGLVLGWLSELNGVAGILPFYALLFLLAIPLLGLAPLVLAGIAAAVIALGPVLLVATAESDLPHLDEDGDPTPVTLVRAPLALLVHLSVTGEYPAAVYLAYLCAGLAIGRLDLGSRRVAWWLLGAGAALAVAARAVSAAVLHPLGGLARLSSGDGSAEAVQELLWDPERSTSWWYLAIPAPHSHTPVDVAHTLGSAMAVLGAALLLSRLPAVARLLRPLALAGAMALTLYSAHLVVLATGVLEDHSALLFLLMVVGALGFAGLWWRRFGPGPLERVVTAASARARHAAAGRLAGRRG